MSNFFFQLIVSLAIFAPGVLLLACLAFIGVVMLVEKFARK